MLIYLGARSGRTVTVQEVALAYGISRNHLVKVAGNLSTHGFVEAVRGNRGGLRLARDPAAINIGDVVRATETDMALVGCFAPDGEGCRISSACLLRSALRKALAAFLAVLDQYTLEDLLVTRPLLEELFALPAAA